MSEHRTLIKEEATSFIIPFDPGTHSYIDHMTGRPRLAAPHGWRAIQLLQVPAVELCIDSTSETHSTQKS